MSKKLISTIALSTVCFATVLAAEDYPIITALPPLEVIDRGFDETAAAELGAILFFDTRLSGDSSTSCASCHSPDAGWSDGSELSRGYPGTLHWRNSQTLINAAYIDTGLHWDGTVPSSEAQVPGAMGTSIVHNIDPILAEERLRQVPEYVARFDAIWNAEPTIENVAHAISAYERTLISRDSPFDLFSKGEPNNFSMAALRGLDIFANKGNCIACHNGPLATDLQFHNTSVPPNISFTEDALLQVTFRSMMRGFGVEREMYDTFDRDPGRYLANLDENELGKMRTPPLRYLTHTAPYMHNGVFYTLEEVVAFYNEGGTEDAFGTKSDLIKPLGLTDAEQSDLVAFLKSMSGPAVTAEYPDMPDYGIGAFPANGTVQVALNIELNTSEEPKPAPAIQSAAVTDQSNPNVQVMTITLDTTAAEPAPELSVFPTNESAPVETAASIITEGGQRFAIVKEGDTLGTLATEVYGDVMMYQDIYDANRDVIPDPTALEVGTKLLLPS